MFSEITYSPKSNLRRHVMEYTENYNIIAVTVQNMLINMMIHTQYTISVLVFTENIKILSPYADIHWLETMHTRERDHTYVVIVTSVSAKFKAMKRLTDSF